MDATVEKAQSEADSKAAALKAAEDEFEVCQLSSASSCLCKCNPPCSLGISLFRPPREGSWALLSAGTAPMLSDVQAIQAGKSGHPGEDKSMAQAMADAKTEAVAAATEVKQLGLRITHIEKELGPKKKALSQKQQESSGQQKALDKMKAEISVLEQKIQRLGYDEMRAAELDKVLSFDCIDALALGPRSLVYEASAGELKALYLSFDECRALSLVYRLQVPGAHCPTLSGPQPVQVKAVGEPAVQELRQKVGQLAAELGVGFSYRDPAPNFDRKRVKGVLARLFGVRDPAMATALEVVAGGKLYNVVLDSEQTGKQLLTHGNLQRRHTFIPLNKIEARSLGQSTIDKARRLV